jgi:hypothetical protein
LKASREKHSKGAQPVSDKILCNEALMSSLSDEGSRKKSEPFIIFMLQDLEDVKPFDCANIAEDQFPVYLYILRRFERLCCR